MWKGAIAQTGYVHKVQIYTGKHGGAERVLEWYKIWQKIERKILHYVAGEKNYPMRWAWWLNRLGGLLLNVAQIKIRGRIRKLRGNT